METFLAEAVGLSALAVVAVQQILKSKVIPLGFANKYPVPTNIVLSIIAAIVVRAQTPIEPTDVGDWIGLVATISIVAAITYNQLVSKWTEVRETEGYSE